MDAQIVMNVFAAAGLAALGWFARTLWEANKDLRTDLARLREDIADKYARRDDFREFAREIRELLVAISEKLDRKADK